MTAPDPEQTNARSWNPPSLLPSISQRLRQASFDGFSIDTGGKDMLELSPNSNTPLIRLDFTDNASWREIINAVRAPSDEGFLASLSIIDDDKLIGESLYKIASWAAKNTNIAVIVVADNNSIIEADHTLLCVDVADPTKRFRVPPGELWSVENNLSLGNMDFDEFLNATESDGVFRGFH